MEHGATSNVTNNVSLILVSVYGKTSPEVLLLTDSSGCVVNVYTLHNSNRQTLPGSDGTQVAQQPSPGRHPKSDDASCNRAAHNRNEVPLFESDGSVRYQRWEKPIVVDNLGFIRIRNYVIVSNATLSMWRLEDLSD